MCAEPLPTPPCDGSAWTFSVTLVIIRILHSYSAPYTFNPDDGDSKFLRNMCPHTKLHGVKSSEDYALNLGNYVHELLAVLYCSTHLSQIHCHLDLFNLPTLMRIFFIH